MKYYEVDFNVLPLSSDATDLLAALAGEAGFETFEETDHGLKGYVQQPQFDRSLLDSLLQTFPMPGVTVSYTVGEAEDRDWNEQWEQQGFEPIVVADRLIIHDGRHLPPSTFNVLCKQSEQARAQPSTFNIEIDARQAFGTGTHETTRMVCATLLELDVQDRRVLDCGSGTGILGITAMKLGARECVAYDIDEWSVDNTRHNAVINRVEITPLLGDATILNKVEGTFDIVMANINRNILLADMPMFRQKMAPGAHLILSGFYTADIPLLTDRAASLGLTLVSQREDGDWACLLFSAAAS
ncbi:MAG: 50S ribosomal protein L11 methyltransferase [Prevotella sp.]|nr:50S ribosomal protein L11 methyltransferase [Prevotella sp.]